MTAARTRPSHLRRLASPVGLSLALAAVSAGAHAECPWPTLDAGLLLARPVVMPTGLSAGIGAGATWGETWRTGVRLSWSRADELTRTHEVTQDDLSLKAVGGVQAAIGNGAVGVRLGLGATAVHEARERAQAGRAGLEGADALQTAWLVAPAGELLGTVGVKVLEDWGFALALGPSMTLHEGTLRPGLIGELGVTWQP